MIPSKEFVEARMRVVLPEPEKVDLDIPKALTDTGFGWKKDLYEFKPVYPGPGKQPELNEKYEMPPLWNLRPRRYANMEELLQEIAELPIDDGWTRKFWQPGRRGEKRAYHIPQVMPASGRPWSCYWLGPDKEDSIILDGKIAGKGSSDTFDYRGRKINPIDGNRWEIWKDSSEDDKFEWTILFSDSHPVIDYTLTGMLRTQHYASDNSWGGTSKHPDLKEWGNPNKPNWTRPLVFSNIWLVGADVYGDAYLALKKLGFWGALDTAINFIEGVEWAYDLADKPEYLSDTPSPNGEASVETKTDPIVDAVSAIKQRNNQKDFIRSGKPSVRATSAEAGQRVSGKDRDKAWEQVKGE